MHKLSIQSVPGVKVTASGFNSRADSESKTSYTRGSNLHWFRSYEFLKSLKIRKERAALCICWSCAVKCAVTDWPFNTRANCSKCPPPAWMHFHTRVTRELVTLWNTAALLMLLAVLRISCSSSSLVFTLCAYTMAFM